MEYFKDLLRMLCTKWFKAVFLVTSVGAFFLIALDVLARPGGGGNYTGGGGDGGGGGFGGGGGGGDLTGVVFYLLFAHPQIGVPVVIAVVVFSLVKRAANPDRRTFRAVQSLQKIALPNLDALAEIKQRDSGFTEEGFLNRVKKMAQSLNEAWCRGDMNRVRTALSDGLMRRFETQLKIMKHQGIRNAMADFEITDIKIHAANSDDHFDTLHVFLNAQARDVEVDKNLSYEEAKNKAEKAPKKAYSEIWSYLRRPGVKTSSAHALEKGECPSCGAALNIGQTASCDHCSVLVNSGEFDWVLAEITQPVEWRPRSTGDMPGLKALAEVDKGFNRQAAEDRASYLFWRWIEALVLADTGPLSKVALPSFKESIANQVKNGSASLFKVAVGGVDLMACETETDDGKDRYHVKVFWSSARSPNGQPAPMINLLTMSRKHGALDKGGLSYARCPECQGPLTENDAPTCDYCGIDLSAGANDWVLDDVRHPEELMLPRINQMQVGLENEVFVAPDMGNPRERMLLLMRMAALVVADGQVTKEERKMITNAAKRWQIPMDAVEPILSGQIEPEASVTMRPSNPRAFLSGLIAAALVDGRIDKKEEKLLIEVGQSLGFASFQVKDLMQKRQ